MLMRRAVLIARALLAGLVLAIAAACGTSDGTSITPPPKLPPDVNISLDPPDVLIPSGETAQFTVAMQGSVAGPWTLSASGYPSGVVGEFSPTTIAPGQTSILSLTADPSAPSATQTLTVLVTVGELSASAEGTITVQADDSGAGGGNSGTGGGIAAGGGDGATGGGSVATGGGGGAMNDPCP